MEAVLLCNDTVDVRMPASDATSTQMARWRKMPLVVSLSMTACLWYGVVVFWPSQHNNQTRAHEVALAATASTMTCQEKKSIGPDDEVWKLIWGCSIVVAVLAAGFGIITWNSPGMQEWLRERDRPDQLPFVKVLVAIGAVFVFSASWMFVVIFYLAFPILCKNEWFHVNYWIMFCLDSGVPGVGFTYASVFAYGSFLVYSVYRAVCPVWREGNQKFKIFDVEMPFTNLQEWCMVGAKDGFTDLATFLTTMGVTPFWFSSLWLVIMVLDVIVTVCTYLDVRSLRKGMILEVIVEDVPQLILSICMWHLIPDQIQEFAVYGALSSIFSVVVTVRSTLVT